MTAFPLRSFAGLVDLASAELGAKALGASDDFFAGVENLIQPGHAVFAPDRYTERGKWMDGWESRRKRTAGHDFCVIELGAPGRVYGFDIDTSHFIGNHPPFAAIEGLRAPPGTPLPELLSRSWVTLLPQSPLGPGCQNLFAAEACEAVSHVRLNIYPDGGVARLRVYGKVEPGAAAITSDLESDELTRREIPPGLVDLAALKNGALALACSDSRFGHMQSLLLPGRARVMGEGWETRRGRLPDHHYDWILIRLARRGIIEAMEVDTNHYKGNYPERCSLDFIDAPNALTTDLLGAPDFSPLVEEVALQADTRHFFKREVLPHGPATHVRLNIFPDGGISRLRLWGKPAATRSSTTSSASTSASAQAVLDALSADEAREALHRCCGSTRWVDRLLASRPFGSPAGLAVAARHAFSALERDDYLEAFSHHPAIGADLSSLREKFASTLSWSSSEQASVAHADEVTLMELAAANRAYNKRFGYTFIVCASGKSAPEMLALLRARLENDATTELRVAALEQQKITYLRLEKLAEPRS
jgi:allantoicase